MAITAYCLKCRDKHEMKAIHADMTPKGTAMLKGTCSKCGGKVSRIVAKAETTGNGIFSALFQAAKPALKKAGEEALKAGATEAAKAAGKKVGEKLGDKVTGKGKIPEKEKTAIYALAGMKTGKRKREDFDQDDRDRAHLALVSEAAKRTHAERRAAAQAGPAGNGVVRLISKKN